MIKNIIIFGTGKAAYVHSLKYKLLGYKYIYFINKNSDNKYNLENIFKSLLELIQIKRINHNESLVDICTPKSVFIDIVDDCYINNFKKIIVEKPFVVNSDYFINKPDLNILMIKNYNYSLLTNYVKDYLKDNNLKILDIYTNFSKNRIKDSFSQRGMLNKNDIPTVFEIEMPHQIYLVNYLCKMKKKNFLVVKTIDMIDKGKRLKNHGYGLVKYNSNGIVVTHESDLTSNTLQKYVSIICNKKTQIEINYCLYDSNIKMTNKGSVIIRNNKKLLSKEFNEDDNVLICLENYINIFNNNLYSKEYQNEIIIFSNEMKSYMNDLGANGQ